uniref:Immulectin 8 n=1 Tax=Hepialus xiaojinensis TaxID=1589740 RepID=A0A219YXH0_9NEOP|nr:immulectin 8 [Hepialus xiaojinensis]
MLITYIFLIQLLAGTLYAATAGTKQWQYTGSQFREYYEFKSSLKAFYKVHRVPLTWHDARTRCDREGAELVAPETYEEVDMLKSVLEKVNAHNPSLFLGIHSLFMKGNFVTLSDVNLEDLSLTWEFGEPNNIANNENCITMNQMGRLADTDCNSVHPFVCKRKAKNMSWNNECNTHDAAYTLAPSLSTCYKLHTQPKNWTTGYDVCKAEGGYLAIINSIEERDFLAKLLEKHPPESILGNFGKDIIYIGFHDLFVNREYRTLEGQTLAEAGYNQFAGNQPDDAPPGERCGSIFRNAQLNDAWCDRLFLFICERSIKKRGKAESLSAQ